MYPSYLQIIKGNYLQYARSYSYLMTIAVSLIIAFGLIPPPDADYATMRFGQYTGAYNSVWIGFVTANLSSIILSLFGFFLIHGSIQKDIDSRMGQIIGTSNISNHAYLFVKFISNFLILFTILSIVFLASIGLFYLYKSPTDTLRILDFIVPYGCTAIPSLLFTSTLAVALEVLLPRKSILQYGFFLIIFFSLMMFSSIQNIQTIGDLLGTQYPTSMITKQVQSIYPNEATNLTVGFVAGGIAASNKIEFTQLSFSYVYLLGRLFWILLALAMVALSGFVFHRFDIASGHRTTLKQVSTSKKAGFQLKPSQFSTEFTISLGSLIKAESLLLLRKNNKWMWLLTLAGMLAMLFVSTKVSHQFILPILWFLQVAVWSDLISKDYTQRTYYFTATSYKPIQRLFAARCITGVLYALCIASPLILKLVIQLQFHTVLLIILGAIFIVSLAVFLAVLTRTKKLFEILFFFLLYCNLNLVSFTDYFGAIHSSMYYTLVLVTINALLLLFSTLLKYQYDR